MIGLLNDWGGAWWRLFGPLLAQNTLFLCVVLLALHLLRRRSARARHAVALAAVIKLLLPPFLPLVPSIAPLEFLPLLQGTGDATAAAPAAGAVAAATDAALTPQGAALLAWAGAALIYLAFVAASTFRLALRLKSAVPVPPAEAARYVDAEVYEIALTDRVSMPLTLGPRPRRIHVPRAWERWSEACRRMVVAHEMAHIRRRDGLALIAQILATALYLFHPLVMLLVRRLKEYREMACDDLSAVGDGQTPARYSRCLVEIAEALMRTPLECESASTLMKRRGELLNRVEYQMKGATMRPLSRKTAVAIATGMVLLIGSLSWYGSGRAGQAEAIRIESGKPNAISIETANKADVRILSRDRAVYENREVDMSELKKIFTLIARRENKNPVFRISVAPGNDMGAVLAVQEMLQALDLRRVEYTGKDGFSMPLLLPSREAMLKTEQMEHLATLRLTGKGSTYLNGDHVPVRNLERRLRGEIGRSPGIVLAVEIEKDAPYGDFLGVLRQIDRAEAKRVHIAAARS